MSTHLQFLAGKAKTAQIINKKTKKILNYTVSTKKKIFCKSEL